VRTISSGIHDDTQHALAQLLRSAFYPSEPSSQDPMEVSMKRTLTTSVHPKMSAQERKHYR